MCGVLNESWLLYICYAQKDDRQYTAEVFSAFFLTTDKIAVAVHIIIATALYFEYIYPKNEKTFFSSFSVIYMHGYVECYLNT